MAKILELLPRVRPQYLALGSHHYVQLSESPDLLASGFRGDLDSVKLMIPSGAAVPDSCRIKIMKSFIALKVILRQINTTYIM